MRIKLLIIGSIVFLLVVLIIGLFLVQQKTNSQSQASRDGEPSSGNVDVNSSYIFASPLRAKANGRDKVRFTVILLSQAGKPLPGIAVRLDSQPPLSFSAVNVLSDGEGKVTIDAASSSVGEYKASAFAGNAELPQVVQVSFD